MVAAELLRDLLHQHLGKLDSTPSGYWKRNCPMCVIMGAGEDKRKRFGIKFDYNGSIGINCFNCNFSCGWSHGKMLSKNFILLFKTLGLPEKDIKILQFEIYRHKNELPEFVGNTLLSKIYWKTIKLPGNSLSIQTWLDNNCTDDYFIESVDYLRSRKLDSFFDVLQWTPDNRSRIILPFLHRNRIVGYCSRKNNDNEGGIKYLNTNPHNYIFNLDIQIKKNRKYVILFEGVFDALVMDGISTLGNHISSEQIQIINSLDKEVIICPDFDKSGEELVNIAIQNRWKVSYPPWFEKYKDASAAYKEYGKLLTLHSIVNSIESSKLSISMKWKKLELSFKEENV